MELVIINAKFKLYIKIIDVLRGLEYAINLGWYDYKTFNLKDYEFLEKV